jgi:predicted nucleotidyltransferase component of viral defense system
MISIPELRRVAGRAGLGVGQAEHEYVQLCALDALSQTPPLAETFCLKGGTALRQLYFPDWRHSVDLDFTVLPSFAADQLRWGLTSWFERVGELYGVRLSLRDYHRANGAARVRAQFIGPLEHPSRLLLDVTLDEPVLLPPQRRPVATGVFAAPQPQVLCYALEEVLAEKMRSILQRGKARDYHDVWRLLKEKAGHFDRQMARDVLTAKCRYKGLATPSVEDLLSPTLLDTAAAYWSQDLIGQVQREALPDWGTVISDLCQLLKDFLSQ